MAERLKFALFGNIYQAKKSASVKQLISLLAARDAELYIDTDFYTYLSQELHFDVCPTGLISDSDFRQTSQSAWEVTELFWPQPVGWEVKTYLYWESTWGGSAS